MHFKFIETQHPLLKEYIEGFYLFDTSKSEKPLECIVFPSNHIIISAYRDTAISISPTRVHFTENKKSPFVSTITFALEKPVSGIYEDNTREITFCFNPLGFNHFIDNDLADHFKSGISFFDLFDDFETGMLELFKEQDEKILQQKAESYWISKLREKDLGLLKNVVARLQEDTEITLENIAEELGVSRQHITRLFDKHICKTPATFKKVARFRKTLQNSVQNLRAKKNLTSLTYESLFYDQSHLIKNFQSLTGMTPGKFFKGNKAFKNGNINWFFPG